MLKKNFIQLMIIMMLIFTFSISAYATNNNEFNATFNFTNDAIKGLVIDTDLENLNDYKVFEMKKGFDKVRTSTFASSRNVSGQGEEGVGVGILVYRFVDGEVKVSFESVKKLGPSGLYSETIPFSNIGINYVLIAAKQEEFLEYKLFEVNRLKEETKEKLENVQVTFVQTKEEVKDKPTNTVVEQFLERFSTFDFLRIRR